MRVGLAGLGAQGLQSLDRTLGFYRRALEREFEVVPDPEPGAPVDAVVNFRSPVWWETAVRPWPVLGALHGAAVVATDYVRDRITNLTTADAILGNCTADGDVVRTLSSGDGPRYVNLPLPVDSAVYRPRDRVACRRALDIAEDGPVIGFVGRLLPQKNVHLFLRFLAAVRRFVPARGLIVGDFHADYPILDWLPKGYHRTCARIQRELGLEPDVVDWYGARLGDEELARAYGAMDLLFHPTHTIDENFGYVVIEAMAAAVPVIGSRYGGLRDTVVHGDTGYTMPTWVADSGIRMAWQPMVDRAVALLADEAAARRLGEAARARAQAVYSEDACGAVLRDAVRACVAAWPGRPVRAAPRRPYDPDAFFPAIPRPWESFREAVERYVSEPAPPPATSRLWAWAPVVDGALDDPCWPARLPLDDADLAVLAAADGRTGPELGSTDRIERLLRWGALVGCETSST